MQIFSTPFKKIASLSILLTIIFWSFPLHIVQAHELKTDGSINSLMHINPDDDPVAGQPADLLFLITDDQKKFKPEDCDCQASVIDNTTTVFSSPLFKGKTSYQGIFAPAIEFTFTHKGIYTIKLTGKPKNANDFQGFAISYDVRVEKDATTPIKKSPKNILAYAIIFLFLLGIGYIIKLFFTKTNTDSPINNLK